MKYTLFISTLTVALLGSGSANAGTGYIATPGSDMSDPPSSVYGAYSNESAVSEGALQIYADDSPGLPEVISRAYGGYAGLKGSSVECCTVVMSGGTIESLYGGFSNDGSANNNIVIVSGGNVSSVNGGRASLGGASAAVASGNKVIVTGGSVDELYGGRANTGTATGNIVYVTGGSCGIVYGGSAGLIGTNQNNQVHLVGAGASVTVDDVKYAGHQLQVSRVAAGKVLGAPNSNSIDIYGTEIIAASLNDFGCLNFHMVAAQLTGVSPMVTITESDGFSLTENLALSFDALENMEWEPGDSVTLVEAQNGMSIASEVLAKEYNIYQNGDPEKILATARLVLEDSQNSTQLLKLTVQGVPEPATGTLSLLALAALAARRRKK